MVQLIFYTYFLVLLLLSSFSRVQLCVTPQMAAHQVPLSLGFSRQEYWSGLPFPSPMHVCMLRRFSCVWLCATPWTAAHQAPLSTGLSRQEYWSGLPFPSPCWRAIALHNSGLRGGEEPGWLALSLWSSWLAPSGAQRQEYNVTGTCCCCCCCLYSHLHAQHRLIPLLWMC